MKKALLKLFFLIFALSLFAMSGYCQSHFVEGATQEQIDEINRLDDVLFTAVFEDCDTAIMRSLLSDDLEFYHDKWGQIASSANQFIETIAMGCESQKTGQNNKSRRTLNKQTVEVFPLSNYGVIHRGKHDFFQMKNGKYVFTESSQFTHIWKVDKDQWKLTRILSYDHKPTRS